jgi:outer membrane usher protein
MNARRQVPAATLMLVVSFGWACGGTVLGDETQPPAPAPLASPTPPATPGLSESLYAVRLNSVDVSDGTLVLEDAAKRIYVAEADLQTWRLHVGPDVVRIARAGTPFIALDSVGFSAIKIDDPEQRLDLTAPPNLFEISSVDVQRAGVGAKPVLQRGAFLNYDMHARLDSSSASELSGAFETGVNIGNGVLDNTELAETNPGHITRLATTWQADDLARDRSLQIGDSFVSEPTIGGDARFAGFRLASNYTAEDGFLTSPEASVLGTAALPSVVDVYVNNVLTMTQNVEPGQFRIQNLPQVDGEGNVQLVVRNLLGQVETITRSYYGASTLLKKGLSEFELAGGIERADYGETGAYGGALLSGTERYGFTDTFTGEFHVEGSNHLELTSVAGSLLVPSVGNLTFGAGAVRTPAGFGSEILFGDEYSTNRDNYGVTVRLRSPSYADVETPIYGAATSEIAANVGFRLTQRSSIDFSYAATGDGQNPVGHVFTIAFGGTIGGTQVALNIVNPIGSGSRYFSLNLLRLLGRNSVTASQTYQNGSFAPGLTLEHSSLSTYGANYTLSATGGPQPFLDAHVSGARPTYDYEAELSDDAGKSEADLDLRGAFADVDGHIYRSRQILDSYGVAVFDGFPGVNVYMNNQVVGQTDPTGRVLIPNLQAYRANAITIDPQSLPLTANVGDVKLYADPYYRSPAIVHFRNSGDGGVIVPIVEADGTPVLSGAIVTGLDGAPWPVADRGEAYIGGLTSGKHTTLQVRRTDGSSCTITFDAPPDLAALPTLKPVTCR